MKKIISTLLVSTILSSAPVMATETETPLPQNLGDMGITAQDLNTQEGIADPSKDTEMDATQWGYRRRCGWGSYLQRYVIRIGRFSYIRYRCVRYGGRYPGYPRPGYPRYPRYPRYPGYYGTIENQSTPQDQSNVQEPVEVQEESVAH
ncbi:MAG TPA: hypothetical protein VIG33_09515 [Pseudobdellovibrionaceae bacterium]